METVIRHTKRTLIFLAAILFFLIGLAGFVLPIIPGLVFIAVALILFSIFFPIIREKMDLYTRRYPKLNEIVLKIDERVKRIVGEV